MFLSLQTFNGLKMSVRSLIAVTKFLLEQGFEFVKTTLSSDSVKTTLRSTLVTNELRAEEVTTHLQQNLATTTCELLF
jgi:tRNA G26 N,N-dimethylase Trm1